ncbi:MAG: hypothetical protein NT135_03130, partial [Candidatus Berkelbacteria bacterium]|nr:hypothetical protein [Candidatus Berkelbacteria bacterium]
MKKIKSILLRFKKNKKADKVEDFLLPQDKNKIEKLAQKKQEYQKVIQQLDYQIELVQKSTKTLIPALAPAHHYLRSHFKWYYRWHIKPYTSIVHTVILLIYLISIPFMFLGGPGAVQKKAKAATAGNPYWEWLTPNPTTNPLLNVTSPDENTIWVTGRYGLIARATKETGESWTLNTVHWTQYDLGTTKSIIDIYVQDNNSIWVIGPDATLYYFNGLVWTNLVSDSGYLINNDLSMSNINISGEALNGISGSGDDVWVVGEGGLILHNNGTTWETQAPSTPTYLSICDVYASATNNVVAMGISNGSTQASIMQYNGSSWSYLTNPYGFAGHFPSICWHEAFYTKQVGVFTSSPTDIWISFWSQGGVVPEGEPNEEHGVDKNFIFQYDADAIHWDLMSAVDEPYGIIVDGRQTDDMVAISPNNDGVPRGINSTTNGWLDTTTAVNDGVTSGAWVNDNGVWKTVRVTKTGEVYVGGFGYYSNRISQDNLSNISSFRNIISSKNNLWIYNAYSQITKY